MQKQIDEAVVLVHQQLTQKFDDKYYQAQCLLKDYVPQLFTDDQITLIKKRLKETASEIVNKRLVMSLAQEPFRA